MKYTDEECETTADNLETIFEAGASFDTNANIVEVEKAIEMLRERLFPQPIEITDEIVRRALNAYGKGQVEAENDPQPSCLVGRSQYAMRAALTAALTEPEA